MIQTMDFFTPVVDDSYTFGKCIVEEALKLIEELSRLELKSGTIGEVISCVDKYIIVE